MCTPRGHYSGIKKNFHKYCVIVISLKKTLQNSNIERQNYYQTCDIDGNESTCLHDAEDEILSSEILLCDAVKAVMLYYSMTNLSASPMRTSRLSGAEYTAELLLCQHERRIREVIRIDKSSFDRLVYWAKNNNYQKTSRNVTVQEQLVMFLAIPSQGLSN